MVWIASARKAIVKANICKTNTKVAIQGGSGTTSSGIYTELYLLQLLRLQLVRENSR